MAIFMRIVFVIIIIIMLLSLVLVPTTGAAPCGATAARVLTQTREGPFDLVVGVLPENPSLGYVRLVATVCDAATGGPVPDAQVTFIPTSPEGKVGAPIYGLGKFSGPEEYSAELSLKKSGLWHYRIEVKSQAGSATTNVSVEIRQPTDYSGATTPVFLLTSGGLLAGALYLIRTARRQRPGVFTAR